MILDLPFTIRDRKQAGLLLAEKLIRFRNSDAIIVGVPYGGVVIGYHLAEALNVPFDVIGCKTIHHPADPKKTIGSISPDQVVIHDEAYDIPRDYLYHQIVLNQNELKAKQAFYHAGRPEGVTIRDAEVIVVGDIVKSADSVLATIRTLRAQKPKKLILAASTVTPDGVARLACEADEIVTLLIKEDVRPGDFYEENSILLDEDIRELVVRSLANKYSMYENVWPASGH